MIIPLHLVPDAGPAPLEFFDARQWQSGPQVTSAGFSLDPALLPGQTLDIGMPIAGPVDVRDLHVLQELMQEFGVEPGRVLMVGDTTHDLQMALNAGCPSVG